jgi:tetratricopeptide (TPR) repeat protein
LTQRNIAHRQTVSDQRGLGNSLEVMGIIALHLAQFDEAVRLHRESLAIFRSLEDRNATARLLNRLAQTLIWHGDFDQAATLLEERLTTFQGIGLPALQMEAQVRLGVIKLHQGQYEAVRPTIADILSQLRDKNHLSQICEALLTIGQLRLAEGQAAQAQTSFEESLNIYKAAGQRAVTGIPLSCLSLTLVQQEKLGQAQHYLAQALRIALETEASYSLLYTLPIAASLLHEQGNQMQAQTLYRSLEDYPLLAKSAWFYKVIRQQFHPISKPQSLPINPNTNLLAIARQALAQIEKIAFLH